jgi:hypothetical protein
MKVFEIMKRTNIKNQEDYQSVLLKMREDGAVKFDIHKGALAGGIIRVWS